MRGISPELDRLPTAAFDPARQSPVQRRAVRSGLTVDRKNYRFSLKTVFIAPVIGVGSLISLWHSERIVYR